MIPHHKYDNIEASPHCLRSNQFKKLLIVSFTDGISLNLKGKFIYNLCLHLKYKQTGFVVCRPVQ